MGKCGEDRHGRIHAGHEIGDRHARLLRTAAWQVIAFAGDAHESAHALDDEVVAGAIGVRTVLPEAGDRCVDEARIQRGDAREVESVFRETAHLEVFDEHVGRKRQLADDALALGFGEIDRHRKLAAVARKVIGRLRRVASVGVLEKRRTPCARVVARAGTLDLDDGGAQVGEQLRAPGAGEHAGQVEDGEVGERAHRSHEPKHDGRVPSSCPPSPIRAGNNCAARIRTSMRRRLRPASSSHRRRASGCCPCRRADCPRRRTRTPCCAS